MKEAWAGSKVIEALDAGRYAFSSADPNRLAAYLQLPNPEEIDEVTASFIQEFEGQRGELLEPWAKAASFKIERVGDDSVEFDCGRSFQATRAYCRQLQRTESDHLVLAALP